MKLPRFPLPALERDRRALRLGASIVLPALFLVFAVKPWWRSLQEVRDRVVAERATLARERALLLEAGGFPARLAEAEQRLLRQAPRLFDGGDPLAGSAALANYVNGVAYRSRVFVQQSDAGGGEEGLAGVLTLRLELRGVSDIHGLTAFVRALETGPRLIRVERLTVEPAQQLGSPSERDTEILAFSATVTGFAVGAPPAESPVPSVRPADWEGSR